MRLEDLNDSLSRLRDWIDNADTKTSVIIAVITLALGFTLPEIKDTKEILLRSGIAAVNIVFLAVWTFYLYNLFFSLYHALHALAPHRDASRVTSVNGRPSVTDFPGIAKLSLEEYIKAVDSTDEEQLRQELIQLCYQFGQGASHKFKHFLMAMWAFRLALIAQIVIFAWITIVLPNGV